MKRYALIAALIFQSMAARAADPPNYIGTDQCIECHQDQHATYLQTTHSVATVETLLENEPSGGAYAHPRSASRYEVETADEKMIHREIRLDSRGGMLAVTEHPIEWTVGSGQHGKSYLYRDGDFWGQSPITWYEETDSWGMSPGFDRPFHTSFHRKVRSGCMYCHVGNLDLKDRNPYQFEIIEAKIGCERCHGPGEQHAAIYRQDPDASGLDDTIVNPNRLPRELAEAICQQCHLQGVTEATRTGKDMFDFRPGMKLTEVRVDYQLGVPGQGMRIVGHVEQMHASECYKQTETLTCVTCHNPHDPVATEDRIEHFRDVCLDCHQDESCGKSRTERDALAGNNCYQCHMPKADTNVAHAAFHHHRIGIHEDPEAVDPNANELLPVLDITDLPERERIRAKALAMIRLMRENEGNPKYADYPMQVTETLIQLKQSGPVDAEVDSHLALMAISQGEREIGERLAKEALTKDPRPTFAHIQAASLLAQLAFQKNDTESAVKLYRQLANYHRDPHDLFFLGLCENNVGNVEAGIVALKRSLEIDPMQVGPHGALGAIYQATGKPDLAAEHNEAQREIQIINQRLRQ